MRDFYEYYGVPLDFANGNKNQLVGDCLFCGKEKHFFVNPENGLYDCKKCSSEGNHLRFITDLHQYHLATTKPEHYEALANARPGLIPEALAAAQLAYDSSSRTWFVPYQNGSDFLSNLGTFKPEYGYRIYKGPAPLSLKLWRPFHKKTFTDTVVVMEGEWDLLAFWPLLHKIHPDWSICSVPGANTFKDEFLEHFKGKAVILMYDKDNPGRKGVSKACKKLEGIATDIKFLKWSDKSFSDANGHEDKGKDIRDYIVHSSKIIADSAAKRKPRLDSFVVSGLKEQCISIQVDQQSENTYIDTRFTLPDIENVQTWDHLISCYRDNLYLTPATEQSIACVFATVLSPFFPGEPLWAFLVGPASSGKTTVLEALGSSNVYVEAQSQLNAKTLVSGQKRTDGKDISLLKTLPDRTLVIKDFTAVLTMNPMEQEEMFGILRDAFDGDFRRQYGNGEVRNYAAFKFAIVAAVTQAIHAKNHAALGERFLKINYLDKTEFDEYTHIQAAMDSMEQKEKRKKILTAHTLGYIDYLANNLPDHLPELTPKFKYKMSLLAMLVAKLRAQVERRRDDSLLYRPDSEVASRLAVQFKKMAQCLMLIYNLKEPNELVYATIRKVGLDSCIPFNIEFSRSMYEHPNGITRYDLAQRLQLPSTNVHRILVDSMQLGIIRMRQVKGKIGRPTELYYLDPFITHLWKQSVDTGLEDEPTPIDPSEKIIIPRRTRRPLVTEA